MDYKKDLNVTVSESWRNLRSGSLCYAVIACFDNLEDAKKFASQKRRKPRFTDSVYSVSNGTIEKA